MACFHPMRAYRVDYQSQLVFSHKEPRGVIEILNVPCGACLGCLLDKSSDWSVRCYCEAKQWEKNCFITLTYDNEHLPKDGYLQKKDVQDFWKRLRYYEKGDKEWQNPQTGKTENPIRYLVCGEYGPKNLRPHYHACVFNWKPKDLKFYKENHCGDRLFTSKTLKDIWGKGFVIIGELNYQSACYVARYVSKKLFKNTEIRKNAKELKIQTEFIDSSRIPGIGLKYWKENQKQMVNNHGILIKIKDKVKNKPIPKYFIRKWNEYQPYECELYKFECQETGKKQWENQLKNTTLTEKEYLAMLENKLKERAKLLKRENLI